MRTLLIAIAILLPAAGMALAVVLSQDSGVAQSSGCDSSDYLCPGRTATAAAQQTTIAEAEDRARTETWREAGATLVAERNYLFGEIATANARLEARLDAQQGGGPYLPAHCHFEAPHSIGDLGHHEGLDEDAVATVESVAYEIGEACLEDSVLAILDVLTATAAATTPTATP